jgi:hypothetical protein
MGRLISAETTKIPDPIMAPTTTIVASNSPNPRRNSVSSSGRPEGAGNASVMSGMLDSWQQVERSRN